MPPVTFSGASRASTATATVIALAVAHMNHKYPHAHSLRVSPSLQLRLIYPGLILVIDQVLRVTSSHRNDLIR